MKPHLFNLCPESASYIPAHGKSAFVRACIIDMGRRLSKSKGTPAPVEHIAAPPFTPASVEPVAVAPVEPVSAPPAAAAPVPVGPAKPVAWVRTWHKPSCEMPADVDYSKLIHKLEGGRSICLNPPPWPAVPGLTRNHYLDWHEYVKLWRFPDPFPGPLEWHSMGEPSEPLPEHRMAVEPVEPLPGVESAPSQESPPPAAEPPVVAIVESPLLVVGMSSNILEDV